MTTIAGLLTIALLVPVTAGIACSADAQPPQAPPPNNGIVTGKTSLEYLVARATAIQIGKVTNLETRDEGNGAVFTMVTLAVEQTLKGEAADQAVIRVPGGKTGGLVKAGTDNPRFTVGERVIVFLDMGTGIYTVAGGYQGKFTIDNNNNVNDKPLSEFIGQVKDIMAKQKK